MSKAPKMTIQVKGTAITVLTQKADDYISLTDIARYRDAERTDYLIQNWLRNRNTIEFLGIWESLNNPDFKNPSNSMGLKNRPGSTVLYSRPSNGSRRPEAVGIVSRSGRYGGFLGRK